MGKLTNTAAAFIPGFSLGFVFAVLFGKKRDLLADAIRVSKRLQPVYLGLENIPQSGPLALVPNHYGSDTFHVFWTMFAITNAVARQRDSTLSKNERVATWLVQNQMPRRNGSDVRPGTFTRWLFPRVLRVYDFVQHDPMPEHQSARAAALHTLMNRATGRGDKNAKPQPVGIFPEGTTSNEHILLAPPVGAGATLSLLSRAGVPLLPVAVYEPNGVYTVRFGPPVTLDKAADLDKAERDAYWATQAMNHIAAMLPPELRGPYGS